MEIAGELKMIRLTTGKSRDEPRLKPQRTQKLNPIYARILKISKKLGMPEYYTRDLIIDKGSINRNRPYAVIWGVRSTGTQLVNLTRGSSRNRNQSEWKKINVSRIEYPADHIWYYITPTGERKVSKEMALNILYKYAEKRGM